MCLSLGRNIPDRAMVATEDVVCYKLLFKTAEYLEECKKALGSDKLSIKSMESMLARGDIYISPYRQAPYKLGKRYESKLDVPFQYEFYDAYRIECGLHTFVNISQALYRIETAYSRDMLVVVKCRIPKGSTYYKGTFGMAQSYASDALILDEVVS